MGVRRRWRVLEEYYNFDEDGAGNMGNPADNSSAEHLEGADAGAKGTSKGSKYSGGSQFGGTGVGTSNDPTDDGSGSDSDSYSGELSTSYSGGSGSYSSGEEGSSYIDHGGSVSYTGGAAASYHSPSKLSRNFELFMNKVNVDVPLVPAMIVAAVLMYCGMVCTAFMYQARPESTFTNCCRLSVNCIRSAYGIVFNLYHCRLGDIPPIVCAMEDDDDLDNAELERMKPRPGIVKALHIEHQKALSRVEVANNPANKSSQARMASIFG